MDTADVSDNTECEVCFDEKGVSISLFTCTHSHAFCVKCVKKWVTYGHPTCPKCREPFPLQNYLKLTDQTDVNIGDISITMEYDSSQSNDIPVANGPVRTTSGRITKTVRCLFPTFIVILVYLFTYWLYTKLEHKE